MESSKNGEVFQAIAWEGCGMPTAGPGGSQGQHRRDGLGAEK